jgi:large subunit ribosomal protein L24
MVLKSIQPRKQRRLLANAPLHQRRKRMSSHLSKDLKKKYLRRSFPIRKGDSVKIVRGEFKGLSGKITDVDRTSYSVKVDAAKKKNVKGTEVEVPIHPSNLIITEFDLKDELRRRSIESKMMRTG